MRYTNQSGELSERKPSPVELLSYRSSLISLGVVTNFQQHLRANDGYFLACHGFTLQLAQSLRVVVMDGLPSIVDSLL